MKTSGSFYLVWVVLFAFGIAMVLAPKLMLSVMLTTSVRKESEYPRWAVHPRTVRIFGCLFLIFLVLIAAGILQYVASASGGVLDFTYGYDNVGNVTSIADPRPGASQSFAVEAPDRLSVANGPWGSLTWTYYAGRNRLTENSSAQNTYTYASVIRTTTPTAWRGVTNAIGDTLTPALQCSGSELPLTT
jgi:hypothetical protein